MPDSSPLPLALLGLWVTLPAIWLGAGALVAMLPADRTVRRMLRPAAAFAAWIVFVQIASMAVRSFWLGLPLGMLLLSLAGMVLWWLQHGEAAPTSVDAVTDFRLSPLMWLTMGFTTLPIAVLAWNGHFHDDLLPIGSLGTVAQLQNDYFPPHLLGFPHVLFRYHYGFDLVCAGLTALTRCRVDTAIRVATVFGWAYCWYLVWILGERLTGTRRGGFWIALATLLGGGGAVFVAPFLTHIPWTERLLGTETFGAGMPLNPPTVSNFFQHRFSLGFPLAVAALVLTLESSAKRPAQQEWSRGALLALILAALSLTQVMLFAALSATLAFTEVVLARRWRFLGVLVGAWAAAWLMGGALFTRIPDSPPTGLYLRLWPTEAVEGSDGPVWQRAFRVLAWHATAFGALLPLGVWGLWRVRQLRAALLLLAAGGLTAPLFFAFHFSWDIVKFSAIAALALGILSGATLNWIAARGTLAARAALALCVVVLTATPLTFVGTVLSIQFATHAVPWYFSGSVALGPDDLQAVQWLRARVKPDELVYRLPDISMGYLQVGGLPTPFLDYQRRSSRYGVWPERAAQIEQVITTRPPELEAYRSIGIKWFVVAPDDPQMERNVQRWEQTGDVIKQAEFGTLRIFKLNHASASN